MSSIGTSGESGFWDEAEQLYASYTELSDAMNRSTRMYDEVYDVTASKGSAVPEKILQQSNERQVVILQPSQTRSHYAFFQY
jgi:hypothetical protein